MTDQPHLREFFVRCARDPVFFVDSLLPVKTETEVDGVLRRHEGQRRWLREAFAPINVLVPGNRFGKSTVVAMRHLWFAFTRFKVGSDRGWDAKPYHTISLAYSSEQANIVFNTIRSVVASEVFRPFVKQIRESPFPKITLFNGSVINVRSAHDNGKYVDGFEYRYMSLDEAGYIDNLKDLVNGVLLMRMAGGGILDLLGTPKGFNDLYWYAERALRGTKRYFGMRGSIYDNPFLSVEDVKMRDEILAHADPRLRQQVIEGDFVDFAGLAFGRDQRENMFRADMPAHVDPKPGHRYVQAWDLGRKTDYTVGVTFDVTERPWLLVDFVRLNRVPWEEIYRLIDDRAKAYGVPLPRIDATGPGGDVIEEELWKRGRPVDPFRVSTGAIKLDLINTLQTAADWGRKQVGEMRIPDEAGVFHVVPVMEEPDPDGDAWGLFRMPPITQLVDEFGIYQMDDKDLVQDCVIAVALAIHRAFEDLMVGEPLSRGLY